MLYSEEHIPHTSTLTTTHFCHLFFQMSALRKFTDSLIPEFCNIVISRCCFFIGGISAHASAAMKAQASNTGAAMKAMKAAKTKAAMKVMKAAKTKAVMKAMKAAKTKAAMKSMKAAKTKVPMKARKAAQTKAAMQATQAMIAMDIKDMIKDIESRSSHASEDHEGGEELSEECDHRVNAASWAKHRRQVASCRKFFKPFFVVPTARFNRAQAADRMQVFLNGFHYYEANLERSVLENALLELFMHEDHEERDEGGRHEGHGSDEGSR